MRVRISMPGVYMAMEMEEEQARSAFHKIAEMLWLIGGKDQKQPENAEPKQDDLKAAEPEIKPKVEPEEAVPYVPELDEKEPLLILDAAETEDIGIPEKESEEGAEAADPKMISSGYGGFLYIKCPSCGKVKGFCAKTRLNNFRCECGSVTKLENLVPLYMNCECGRNSRYLTNVEELAFDITCYDCGNPVAVAWKPKKKQYETIR